MKFALIGFLGLASNVSGFSLHGAQSATQRSNIALFMSEEDRRSFVAKVSIAA